MDNELKVALAQIAPVWLNKEETIAKIEATIVDAANNGSELIVFGEALLPGYPFWLALTGGAEWNTKVNKELHGHYVKKCCRYRCGRLNFYMRAGKKTCHFNISGNYGTPSR